MSGYKHIETSLARFISGRYLSALEIGAGRNTHAAELMQRSGLNVLCTDLTIPQEFLMVPYEVLNVCDANPYLYQKFECVFAIRPIEEMMESLIRFAEINNSDLFVYHLGFEGYSHTHRIVECGISLCQYVIRRN